MSESDSVDQAFRKQSVYGRGEEMTFAGALSFLRRKYSRDLQGIDVAVSGIPYDCAVTNRPGARLGPRAIRAASTQLSELDSFAYGFDPFEHMAVIDYGDCFVDVHHPDTIVQSIEEHISTLLQANVNTLTFGGDHFIAYPALRAHAKKHGPVALLHFDAHSDTWEDDGEGFDHGSMFLRAKNEGLINVEKSIQIGIRTHNDSTHGFKILTAPWVHRNGADATVEEIRQRIGDHKVYLSFDIDCLDPSCAPGTGTPVIGGLNTVQALDIIRSLDFLDFVGADFVEVSPPFDVSEMTALTAATLAYEYLCLLALKKGSVRKPYPDE